MLHLILRQRETTRQRITAQQRAMMLFNQWLEQVPANQRNREAIQAVYDYAKANPECVTGQKLWRVFHNGQWAGHD